MTAYNKSLSGNQTFSGNIIVVRWYSGAFKFISLGTVRAVYKALNLLTKNRGLQ